MNTIPCRLLVSRKWHGISNLALSWLLAGMAAFAAAAQLTAVETGRDPFVMQEGRGKFIDACGTKTYYPANAFNLDDLPAYVPEQQVSGILRMWGSDMFGGAGLRGDLANGFKKHQPGVTVEYNLKSNMLAVTGLLDGTAQIGQTHALTWETLLGFQRLYHCDPLTI
jgi:hypothetical protein